MKNNNYFYYLDRANLITETDLQGNITYANEAFCKISKYSMKEIVGKPHSIVNSGLHTYKFWEEFWECLLKGSEWSGEICNRDKEGSLYWVHTHIFPRFDKDGKIESFISIRKDITRSKHREVELRQLKEEKERLEKLESLHLIVAGVGHEINNPLTVAHGYLNNLEKELAKKMNSDEELVRESLLFIKDSHKRIKGIVKSIKSFSRIKKANISEQSLYDVIRPICDLFFKTHKGFVTFNIDDTLEDFKCHIDKQLLQQVFINLIENSIDSHDEKNRIVKISLWAIRDQENKRFSIFFSDNGPGVDMKYWDKIFIPFYTTKAPGKGTGLGLALCKEYCKQMGGDIEVCDSSNNGLTFKITLKCRRDEY